MNSVEITIAVTSGFFTLFFIVCMFGLVWSWFADIDRVFRP